jgi:ABC-2 type transport system ATP-binding protein
VTDARGTAAVEARGISVVFDGSTAVESLDLTVRSGEMFGLVGPDGAGKSTAIRVLSGILRPSAGEATVLGHDLVRDPRAVRTRVGYLSQSFTLYGDLTVDENIEFFARLHGVGDFESSREELLSVTRLGPARSRLAGDLSGGMKKKLALACTLVHTPGIVFLDEPSTGVDPISRGEFWNILTGILDQGVSVVLTTPYLDEVERCDRVGLMYKGRIVQTGTPEEVRASTPGSVYAIECPDPRAAYRVLRAKWAPSSLTLRGDVLRLWTSRGEGDAREATSLIAREGACRATFSPVTPTLEDAFIALLETRSSQEAPA